MQRYVRPCRLRELEDDLSLICEDLLANRPQPVTGLPQDVVRIPFSPGHAPAVADGAIPGPVAVCRDLLAAIADALDWPPPAGEADEGMFLRLRSDRARLALAALRPVLADTEYGPGQMAEAAGRLRDGVAACPAGGYAVSSLSSCRRVPRAAWQMEAAGRPHSLDVQGLAAADLIEAGPVTGRSRSGSG